MTARRARYVAVLVGLSMASAACASGGDSGGAANGPDVTLGTVPSPETSAEPTTTSPSPEADEPPEPTPSDPTAVEPASPTTILTPSPEADLPTEATQTEAAPATTLPGPLPRPAVRLIEVAAFSQPVEATGAPGDTRLFVVQQGGIIVAVDDESNDVVFDIADVELTTFSGADGEQGLLGLAFHPDLDLAYINFTNGDGTTIVAEFEHDPLTFEFDPSSFREVISIEQPFGNHNGGELVFGPDELLYVGTGDGGSADDPNRVALDVSSRLGKILRIDPTSSDTEAFTVPDGNPFTAVDGADPTIWSLGLRNPWRFSFDSLTGDLWIGDVGQNLLEEVNLAPSVNGLDAGRGISFGWSAYEAADRFNEDQPADGHTLPVASYIHEDGNCSISGGVVARNSTYSDLNGWYIYGDYCSGRVWGLDTTSVTSTPDGPLDVPTIVELATVPALAAVVEGPFGDIYALSVDGPIYRLGPA